MSDKNPNKKKNSIEMFSRRRSSTNKRSSATSSYGVGNGNGVDNINNGTDIINPTSVSPIQTISGRRSSQSVVFVRTPSMLSNSASQPPSMSTERKKSRTGSDISDKSEISKSLPKKRRMSNALTSSFLRRKREEYAGIKPNCERMHNYL